MIFVVLKREVLEKNYCKNMTRFLAVWRAVLRQPMASVTVTVTSMLVKASADPA